MRIPVTDTKHKIRGEGYTEFDGVVRMQMWAPQIRKAAALMRRGDPIAPTHGYPQLVL